LMPRYISGTHPHRPWKESSFVFQNVVQSSLNIDLETWVVRRILNLSLSNCWISLETLNAASLKGQAK
jgi:hypothetical protein